jgi:hypothetical protein
MKKLGFLMLAIALMLGGSAFAQNVGDNSVYFTTYYANTPYPASTTVPDATVRVINDGDTGGTLWADFYVFDDSQELTECCACGITPDGLLSESVQRQLTSTPLTGIHRGRGVIKLISSSSPNPFTPTPVAGLRAWATHIQAQYTTNVPYNGGNPVGKAPFYVTETQMADSNLAAAELNLLGQLCYFAEALLSGNECPCTPEDYDF